MASQQPPSSAKSIADWNKRGRQVDRKEYFKSILKESGTTVDLKTVKYIYYAIIRTVLKDLKSKGWTRVPDLVDFRLTPLKKMYYVPAKKMKIPIDCNVVRTSVNSYVKKFIKNVGRIS